MNETARFAKAITILARTFRTEVDEFLIEGYQMGLDGVTIDQLEDAVRRCCASSKFMPSPVELKESVGIGSVLKLYRKAPIGKCACGLELSFPESHRRGYCGKCWRGILEANCFTPDDERAALNGGDTEKPKALPRSGGDRLGITGSDFDV